MIDTIGLLVPLDRKMYEYLITKTILTQRIDQDTGAIEFEYYNYKMHQSWNYKVMFKFDERKYIYDPNLKKTFLSPGFPHMTLEFSAPKILYGNNLVSIDVVKSLEAVEIVRMVFDDVFKVKLPSIKTWFLTRLDVCANFVFSSEQEVKNYIKYMQRMDFSRRIKNLYEDTGIYFASRHNTLKFYAKGEEFKKHDKQRFVDQIEAQGLHNNAKKILRVEVELKNRLKYIVEEYLKLHTWETRLKTLLWNGYMRLYKFIDIVDVKGELERMLTKFLICKETKVMRTLNVFRMLRTNFSDVQTRSFYAVYCMILTQGMKETRRQFSINLIYRAVRAFRELGISFVVEDIKKLDVDLGFPKDFTLELSEDNKYYQLPIAA